jgi:hypothetical protein
MGTMKRLSFHNQRWTAWLLSVAFGLMASVSQASWQCLDGHPCPPGCTMQHMGEAANRNPSAPRPACCVSRESTPARAAGHCAKCADAKPSNSRIKGGCTSPICVKRIADKPHASGPVHVDLIFDFDSTAVLLPEPAHALAPEAAAVIRSSPPRAPPGRTVVSLYSPRAPPTIL